MEDPLALYDSDQLGALLGVHRKTVEHWRHARKGPPYVQIGRTVLYRRAAVIKWFEQQEKLAETDPATPPEAPPETAAAPEAAPASPAPPPSAEPKRSAYGSARTNSDLAAAQLRRGQLLRLPASLKRFAGL